MKLAIDIVAINSDSNGPCEPVEMRQASQLVDHYK